MGYHFSHHKFSESEKRLLKKPEDFIVISLIDNLSQDQICAIDKVINANQDFLKHYNMLQRDWINSFRYFWGKNGGKDPQNNIVSCLEDYRKSQHPIRYKLWFSVFFPDEISLRGLNKEYLELTMNFLSEAREEIRELHNHPLTLNQLID